jgi:20S proteasome alpha/beta subunit
VTTPAWQRAVPRGVLRTVQHLTLRAAAQLKSAFLLEPVHRGCLQVWACPIGGTLVREQWTTDGSGSTYIWGFLDSEYR